MNHDEWLARAEIYALGALDGEDLDAFQSHLAEGCPICERHLQETDEILALLPRALPAFEPDVGARDRLLALAFEEREVSGPGAGFRRGSAVRKRFLPPLGGLAAACVVAALTFGLWVSFNALRDRDRRMRALELQVASLEDSWAIQQQIIKALADPATRAIELRGQATASGVTGRVLWSPAKGTGVLVIAGLPPAPPGQVYELWAIDKSPIPAGVFLADARGQAVHLLPALPDATGVSRFAITIEPAGGSPKPTSPILLDSNL